MTHSWLCGVSAKSASELLKETDTAMAIMVAVEGKIDGETVHVTKITEVKAAAE